VDGASVAIGGVRNKGHVNVEVLLNVEDLFKTRVKAHRTARSQMQLRKEGKGFEEHGRIVEHGRVDQHGRIDEHKGLTIMEGLTKMLGS